MPDPKSLKVGDRIRFISIPAEWSAPSYVVPREDMIFMKRMIKRPWPSRVYQLDYLGYTWIRFISIPAEWSAPSYVVPREDMIFMKRMIKRPWPSRVYQLDYLGYPWI